MAYAISSAGVRASSLLARLVDALFDTPALTINAAHRLLGVTHRAATVHITTLLDAGLLVEIPASGRVRRFIAREILMAGLPMPPKQASGQRALTRPWPPPDRTRRPRWIEIVAVDPQEHSVGQQPSTWACRSGRSVRPAA